MILINRFILRCCPDFLAVWVDIIPLNFLLLRRVSRKLPWQGVTKAASPELLYQMCRSLDMGHTRSKGQVETQRSHQSTTAMSGCASKLWCFRTTWAVLNNCFWLHPSVQVFRLSIRQLHSVGRLIGQNVNHMVSTWHLLSLKSQNMSPMSILYPFKTRLCLVPPLCHLQL